MIFYLLSRLLIMKSCIATIGLPPLAGCHSACVVLDQLLLSALCHVLSAVF